MSDHAHGNELERYRAAITPLTDDQLKLLLRPLYDSRRVATRTSILKPTDAITQARRERYGTRPIERLRTRVAILSRVKRSPVLVRYLEGRHTCWRKAIQSARSFTCRGSSIIASCISLPWLTHGAAGQLR